MACMQTIGIGIGIRYGIYMQTIGIELGHATHITGNGIGVGIGHGVHATKTHPLMYIIFSRSPQGQFSRTM